MAGATRGAGRGIAVGLGAEGATVYATGRSTRDRRSEVDRPETIEETAELVDRRRWHRDRGRGRPSRQRRGAALVARIEAEQGRLDVLVNDVWGAEHLFEWDTPVWEHDLDSGLRLVRLALETHLITSHHALPLLIARPGGLLIEVTDGTAEYNAERYRDSLFYDLAKNAVIRLAWAQAHELAPHGATAVALTPGLAALGGDARGLRRHRGDVARGGHAGSALLQLGVARLRRSRRRGAGRRSRRGALERAVAVERRASRRSTASPTSTAPGPMRGATSSR